MDKYKKNRQEKAGSQSYDKQVVINLHSKYEHSSVYSCREIFDEKCHSSKYGWKENWTNIRKHKQEKAGSQSQDKTSHHQPAQQI